MVSLKYATNFNPTYS